MIIAAARLLASRLRAPHTGIISSILCNDRCEKRNIVATGQPSNGVGAIAALLTCSTDAHSRSHCPQTNTRQNPLPQTLQSCQGSAVRLRLSPSELYRLACTLHCTSCGLSPLLGSSFTWNTSYTLPSCVVVTAAVVICSDALRFSSGGPVEKRVSFLHQRRNKAA